MRKRSRENEASNPRDKGQAILTPTVTARVASSQEASTRLEVLDWKLESSLNCLLIKAYAFFVRKCHHSLWESNPRR